MLKAIPAPLNLSLCAAMIFGILLQTIAMPVFLPSHPILMVLIVLCLIPLNVPFWSLIHEAIHKNLHPNLVVNENMGRLLSVLFGAGFDVLRFGHLMHHQYNREWESEIYDSAKHNKYIFYANHYFKMLGGLYFIEVITSFLIAISPLPVARRIAQAALSDERHQQAVLSALLKPRIVLRLRIDCVLIVLFHIGVFTLFGAQWWIAVIWLLGRAIIVSLMDNAYHYGTPADNSVIAKELAVPGPIATFILNFNHHATHHRNTALSWIDLKTAHDAQAQTYTEKLASALIAQFKGPIRKV